MRKTFVFLFRNKPFFIFLVLFGIAFLVTLKSRFHHKTFFLSSANMVMAKILEKKHQISSYLYFGDYNQMLLEENKRLHHIIENFKVYSRKDSVFIDTTSYNMPYKIYTAEVIKNSFFLSKNYLTINKGEKEGAKVDMGVINFKGIVGIVENVSNHYAIVQSVLNVNSKINVSVKNTNYFGTLIWNLKEPNIVQLEDVPTLLKVQEGDTIVTAGMSHIFPKGVPVGTVKKVSIFEHNDNYYYIDVKLFADMTQLGPVYLIENKNKLSIDTIEDTIEE